MTKARDLGKLVSQGQLLADGVVQASEVTGLASVATSGNYTDLINKPTSTGGGVTSYTDLTNKPTFATVATTGSYADLTNKPTIPSVTGLASETFVSTQINNLVNAAPATLDTLKEIADQLAIDQSATAAITTALTGKANTSSLSTVATTGSYTDLTNKPTIPTLPTLATVATTGSYTDLINKPTSTGGSGVTSYVDLTDKPTFAAVATSGSYADLTNKPTIPSGSYTDLTNKPTLFSGSYTDLTNKPTIPSGSYTDLTNKPTFATVATTGSYADLTNKPTIPTLPTLATVATTGSYTDLINKPVVATLKVTTIAYPGDDLAADPAGGQTITLTGTGFTAGLSVLVNTTMAAVVTVVSSTQVTFTAPAMAAGTYVLYLVATDGSVALSLPGISYSGFPAWSTTAGTLGTQYETTAISKSLSATGDGTVTYSLVSGTLPPNSTLNTSTGAISGTAPVTNSSTTYNFTIRATDAQNQDTDRAFSITLDPDSVTWSNPATNVSVTADINTAYTQALAATSAAGNSVSYSSTQLPAGITLTGNTLSGTFTAEETVNTTVTVTAANSNRTATRTVSFTIALGGDEYFKNVILLLTGNGAAPELKTYTVTNSGASDYLINGVGDPSITLVRESTYTFNVNASGHPFWIKTAAVTGTGSAYNTGVTNNGTQSGTITFVVPSDAPATLYYICQFHGSMVGTINVIDPATNNNTFKDSSINNFPITRVGNTSQGSFSPYGPNWSNYFDGNSYLTIPNSTAFTFGTGDFTSECWINKTGWRSSNDYGDAVIMTTASPTDSQGFGVIDRNGQYAVVVATSGSSWGINVSTGVSITNNSWIHVAFVRYGNNFYLYQNGIQIWTQSASGYNLTNTNNLFSIGGRSVYTQFFTGYISNARVVKGTAVYTGSFTPSTTPLTSISGTSLLTCADNRFIDDSTNTFPITITGTPTIQRFSPFSPTAAYSAGSIGGSGYFDGSTDYLAIPNGSHFSFASNDFTIEAWVYIHDSTTRKYVFGPGTDTTSHYDGFGLEIWDNRLCMWASSVANSWNLLECDTSSNRGNILIPVKAWTHIAVTRTGGNTFKSYVNGVLDKTFTVSGAISNNTNIQYNVGRTAYQSGNFYFNGLISDFRVVNGTAIYTSNFTLNTAPLTTPTNTSLLLNFTNSAIYDNAMQNNFETIGSAQVSTTTKKYGTGSLLFNGSTDYVWSAQTIKFRLTFCIEFWMYRTTTPSNQWIVCARQGYGNALPNNGFLIGYYGGSIAVAGTNLGAYWITGNIPINSNTWHHVAVCGIGTGCAIYIDGNLAKYEAWPAGYTGFSMDGIIVGAGTSSVGQDGSVHYGGYIDDLRITNGLQRYVSNFTPPTAALRLR